MIALLWLLLATLALPFKTKCQLEMYNCTPPPSPASAESSGGDGPDFASDAAPGKPLGEGVYLIVMAAREREQFSDELLEPRRTRGRRTEPVGEARQFARTEVKRAIGIRNGLMIAVLALCPIRLKNFAALALGTTFREI